MSSWCCFSFSASRQYNRISPYDHLCCSERRAMTDISRYVLLPVLLLLIAISVILITRKLTVPYTLGLVVVGFLISFFGHVSEFHLTPELVLFVFLPALLFEGSWSMSLRHLRANWPTILMLVGPGLLLELALIAVPLHFF